MNLSSARLIALPFLLVALDTRAASTDYKRSVAQYAVPDVTLINEEGARIRLKDVLASGKPTFVQLTSGITSMALSSRPSTKTFV